MNQEPADGREHIRMAVLKSLLYADIFEYPLTIQEICRYLPELDAPLAEVSSLLSDKSFAGEWIYQHNGFYALSNKTQLGELRERRSAIAQYQWRRARRYATIIAHLPFVRMVAVTGALAVDNVESGDDIDLLVVTAPGRLWLSRALVILVVHVARMLGDQICPNYFLTERALRLDECNFFVAHELAQMVLLYGTQVYYRMRALNAWTHAYLPQADGPPPAGPPRDLSRPGRALQACFESGLGGRIGSALEGWEMRRKIAKLSRQAGTTSSQLAFSADCCKGHFDGHGRVILGHFERRLREYGLEPRTTLP